MSVPRIEVTRTLTESGTFKCPVRDAVFHWADLVDKFQIPDDAYMAVEIPGGGDWSGERVDASELELVVTWKRQVDVE
ncbi:MAG TPA: hypothetical protein VIG24_12845 [Acidimicrobiia bacterium]